MLFTNLFPVTTELRVSLYNDLALQLCYSSAKPSFVFLALYRKLRQPPSFSSVLYSVVADELTGDYPT